MRLMTFRYSGQNHVGVVTAEGVAPVLEINTKHNLRLPNSLRVITEHNGVVCSRDFVRNMKMRPLGFDVNG